MTERRGDAPEDAAPETGTEDTISSSPGESSSQSDIPQRPSVLAVNPDGIPEELQRVDQWVVWKLEYRPSQKKPWTKVPYQVNGRHALVTARATWSSFAAVLAAYQAGGFNGIGFVFSEQDDFFGLDLDDVRSPGKTTPDHLKAAIKELNTYTEVSPSGTGFHAIGRGTLPVGARRRGNVEMYDSGRFFCVTGRTGSNSPGIRDCSDVLPAVHTRLLGPSQSRAQADPKTRRTASADLDDETLLAGGRSGPDGKKFAALFDRGELSEYDDNESQADFALCTLLLKFTGGDVPRANLLFRQSKLMRPKWDEPRGAQTYGELTLANALKSWEEKTESPPLEAHDLPQDARFERSDTGNAQLLARRYGVSWVFDPARERDLVWRPGAHRWAVVDAPRGHPPAVIIRAAQEGAGLRHSRALGSDNPDKESKWALGSRELSRLVHAIKLARALPPIDQTGTEWDAHPNLLAVANGVIDLQVGTLRDGTREDRITRGIGVVFDATATCPLFDKFLDDIFLGDQDLVSFVWRAIGYSLTGESREHKWFVLYGSGRNGKGTLLRLLDTLLGEFAQTLPFRVVEAGAQYRHPAETAELVNKRFAYIDESPEHARLDEGTIKAMTGGGVDMANAKYKRPVSFERRFKLWFATNYLPEISDESPAFWDRILVLPFKRTLATAEQNHLLDAELLRELPGILAKATLAARDWYRDGLQPPRVVEEETADYRAKSDSSAAFVTDCCVEEVGAKGRVQEMFDAYQRWAERMVIPPANVLERLGFGKKMERRFGKNRDSRTGYYPGVRLNIIEETVQYASEEMSI